MPSEEKYFPVSTGVAITESVRASASVQWGAPNTVGFTVPMLSMVSSEIRWHDWDSP